MEEKYYLLKKSDVDAIKSALPNSLESDYDAGQFSILSRIGVELGKEIDLSDEAIVESAKAYSNGECNSYYGYLDALMLLKEPNDTQYFKETYNQ